MWSRLSIVVGLVAGMATAALLMVGIVAVAPEPVPSPTPAPTLVLEPSEQPGGPGTPAPGVTPGTSPGTSGAFGVGQPAPPLVVRQVGGGTIDLAALRGQPVWVNFMATYCPPCVDEFPLMNGFAARHADDGLVIVAVDVREDEGTVGAFAERLEARFPIGLDPNGAAAERWGAVALPVHFWIDAEGVVRHGALGGIGRDMMAEGLAAILPAEAAPSPEATP